MDDTALPTLAAGTLLAERYRVLGHLGTGGMGAVYRVEHVMMAKQLALKLLRPELSSQASVVERFEREARSSARLDHPHVVRITDFGRQADGALYMVMELVEGPSLADVLRAGPRPGLDWSARVLDQILAALEHAHAHGVVHRDIKPGNVMLTRDERVKLVDFGIAKITATDEAQLTQLGMVVGTPRYMAPEQAAGEAVDARADLYSVGVLAYELLTGRAPFEGSSMEVLTKHLTQPVPPLLMEGVDSARARAVEAVILHALEKPRDRRYATATELRTALATAFATGTSAATDTMARPEPRSELRVEPAPRWSIPPAVERALDEVRAQPRRTQLGLLVAVLLVLYVGLRLVGGGEARLEGEALVAQGQAALARGDLPAARAIVLQAMAEAPPEPHAYLLQAALALAEEQPELALSALRQGIERDAALAADPLVESAVRAQVLRDHKLAPAFLGLLTRAHSAPVLAELAQAAKSVTLRREAFAALERLGATDTLDAEAWLTEELRTGTKLSCAERKWYVLRLIALDTPTTLATLKKEQARRGGFLNLSSESECMATELRAQIKALEARAAD
jgi:tRNA A-37 threonylcarbamoyl transferase component Bud32